MSSPFFTIITATYNAASTLPRLLESLAHQTCQDFEIIIQDGASSDGTCAVAEAGRQILPGLSLASEKDSGVYDAWNKALKRVQGKWVLFIGADDTLADEQVLASVRGILENLSDDVLFAAGSARMLRPDGAFFECIPPRTTDALAILRNEMPACHTAIFHRASLFLRHSFNPEYKILGDYDLLCRTWSRASQGVDLPVFVTDMAMGGLSFSLERLPAAFMESVKIQWNSFSWIPPRRFKLLLNSLIIVMLCRVRGKDGAARIIDGIRHMRGKPPKWTLLLSTRNTSRDSFGPDAVTVVILNFNGAEDTIACLKALYAMPGAPGQVIVVDNNSTDNSVDDICEAWRLLAPFTERDAGASGAPSDAPSSSILLLLPENGGYAAGNNAGIRVALQNPACRAVWILNNDTEPEPNALQELCDRLNVCPEAGMCGSTLAYAHDREIVQCTGGFKFSKYTGATPALHGNEHLLTINEIDPASVSSELAYICGASMLVRRELFERIGCLAEEYFLYYEDAEFGLRAKKAGYTLAWAPGSVVFHKEGSSTGAQSSGVGQVAVRSEFVDYLALRNRIYLVRKHYPAYLPVAAFSYAGVTLNRLRRGQSHRVPLVLQALWDGLRGRMGIPLPVSHKRLKA